MDEHKHKDTLEFLREIQIEQLNSTIAEQAAEIAELHRVIAEIRSGLADAGAYEIVAMVDAALGRGER